MKIEKNKVVLIDYTLKDDGGSVIDSSDGREPLGYIHGIGNLIPGLEEALEGKGSGDKVNVSIPPEKGYGAKEDSLVQSVPRAQFEAGVEIKAGMQFQAQTEHGTQLVTVTAVDDQTVTVDGNHPLAGMTLHFNVEIKEIREASKEELDHGHVHGEGGHHH